MGCKGGIKAQEIKEPFFFIHSPPKCRPSLTLKNIVYIGRQRLGRSVGNIGGGAFFSSIAPKPTFRIAGRGQFVHNVDNYDDDDN